MKKKENDYKSVIFCRFAMNLNSSSHSLNYPLLPSTILIFNYYVWELEWCPCNMCWNSL